ncbi:MAG: hypothetical protein COZ38_03165 [Rhodocyclales bacterium CG_4_10_14_3_um_filter_68_10]|nr:MAG: hypothetical protein COZ38_03165 [Rhodocyclales bacterium CG_4_10_14_3_um_filter_68_10]
MPIYEFRCPRCGHQFEDLVFRQSEIQELSCPRCGNQDVSQLLSTFSSSKGQASSSGSKGCAPGSFS